MQTFFVAFSNKVSQEIAVHIFLGQSSEVMKKKELTNVATVSDWFKGKIVLQQSSTQMRLLTFGNM